MSDDRRNIKLPPDVFDPLNEERQDRGMKWPAFLAQLHENAARGDRIEQAVARETDRIERIVERETIDKADLDAMIREAIREAFRDAAR